MSSGFRGRRRSGARTGARYRPRISGPIRARSTRRRPSPGRAPRSSRTAIRCSRTSGLAATPSGPTRPTRPPRAMTSSPRCASRRIMAFRPTGVNPIGFAVWGADRAQAGIVRDLWVDRAECILRYYEVGAARGQARAAAGQLRERRRKARRDWCHRPARGAVRRRAGD